VPRALLAHAGVESFIRIKIGTRICITSSRRLSVTEYFAGCRFRTFLLAFTYRAYEKLLIGWITNRIRRCLIRLQRQENF
jgi:hypothetical protein